MAKLSDYLKDAEGNPSSSRLFSYYFMWFFFISNLLILVSVFFGSSPLDMNSIIVFLVFDALVLIATFAPKQLNKIEEVRKLIELAKK
ncbi:hypothetical protein LCGC14_1434490 [marine sediment metagenome]|uniref:Uncharacterized protein n=1 Tax=marine sediment metagenome TaxID=412755 RepID=A0A0F9K8T2_9ZZZZ